MRTTLKHDVTPARHQLARHRTELDALRQGLEASRLENQGLAQDRDHEVSRLRQQLADTRRAQEQQLRKAGERLLQEKEAAQRAIHHLERVRYEAGIASRITGLANFTAKQITHTSPGRH